jgi:hypothetical protein
MTRFSCAVLGAVVLLLVAGCGGGGSASPEGAASDVLSAIQSERFERMYRTFLPHHSEDLRVNQEVERFQAENTENWWSNNSETLSGTGEGSLDPGRKLSIENQEAYFRLTPEQHAALHGRWYARAHRWDRFSDRMDDLRLVRLAEDLGPEGSGGGTVTYRNRYGDSLTVRLRRFRGAWYVTDVRLQGDRTLPTRTSS